MNLTLSQKYQIALVVLGVLVASTGQLTDLFGPQVTKYVVSASGLLIAIVSGIGTIVTGQGQQIQAVQAMPGVDKIVVNEKANATLATLAVDPAQDKIEAKPSAEVAVQDTANIAAGA